MNELLFFSLSGRRIGHRDHQITKVRGRKTAGILSFSLPERAVAREEVNKKGKEKNILPITERIPNFHRLDTCAAGRTKKKKDSRRDCPFCVLYFGSRQCRLPASYKWPITYTPHDKAAPTAAAGMGMAAAGAPERKGRQRPELSVATEV